MKVILRADIADLGKRGDLVEVATGHARNYLIPQHLAMVATDGTEAQADAMRRARDQRDAVAREQAEEMAKTLVTASISIAAKAGDSGKLFGSITSADLRTLGTHTATLRPHGDVSFPVTIEVVPA